MPVVVEYRARMSLSTQQGDNDSQYLLMAKIDNVRNVYNILKAIHFKDTATVFASDMGSKVTVEDVKCVQANAFIQAGIFHEFIIKEEQVTFKDCLTIFGANPSSGVTTSLKMCYGGYGHRCPLISLLEEEGVITDCNIKTLEPDEILDFNFCSSNVINKSIMKTGYPLRGLNAIKYLETKTKFYRGNKKENTFQTVVEVKRNIQDEEIGKQVESVKGSAPSSLLTTTAHRRI